MKSPKDHKYSRDSALWGGLLVDVSEAANEVGLQYPVAVTASLARLLRPSEYLEKLGVSFEERAKMLLSVVRQELPPGDEKAAAAQHEEKLMVPFIITRGPLIKEELIAVIARIHDGDDGMPVITLYSPEPTDEAA